MALRSGFFMSVNGDRTYRAAAFAEYFATFIGNGVFPNPSNGMQVVANSDMTVTVKPGKAWINGYYGFNDADYNLTLDVADGVLNRIDRIVLQYDALQRDIFIIVKKGTPASTPVVPALQRDVDVYEIALADVAINKGAVSINQSNITDLRLNKEYCGIVHGLIDQVDTTELYNQYLDFWNTWKAQKMDEFAEFQIANQTEFDTWFESVKGMLEGDVAANLSLQISALSEKVTSLEKTAATKEEVQTLSETVTAHKDEYSKFKNTYYNHAGNALKHKNAVNCVQKGTYAYAEGYQNIAIDGKAYEIKSFDNSIKTVTLDKIDGLSVGNDAILYSQTSKPVENIKITSISGLVVTLQTDITLNDNYKFLVIGNNSNSPTHAEGGNTLASGYQAHAEGYGTRAVGSMSHAEGVYTTAKASYSHAEGNSTVASGVTSHAEGDGTVASGGSSHAEGSKTTASGSYSHAEGWWASASGVSAHAEGQNTKAVGASAHAEGSYTEASGYSAHAEGNSTVANVFYGHAMGVYNKKMQGSEQSYASTNDAFVIGNGTSNTSRSNAFRVTFAGKTYGLASFNSSGADYAEYFEWQDGNETNEDRVGYFVTLEEEKIRKANSKDNYILGVVSANPSVIGDSCQDDWHGKYEKDEWGRIQYQYIDVEAEYDEEGNEISPARRDYIPVYNKLWNSKEGYVPREQRKEWSPIGMMGKLLVRDDGTCQVNGYCKPNDNGIATASESGYRVMQRVTENIVMILVK